MKTSKILSLLLLSLNVCGVVSQIDTARVQEFKTDIEKRVYRNKFLKGGIYSTVALVAAFTVYNYFKVPSYSNEQIAKALEIKLENKAQQVKTSKSFTQKLLGVGSDIARTLGSGLSFVAQNVVLTIGAESALKKSERVLKFPGNITWFISHETDLDDLLQDYLGYGKLLSVFESSAQSNIDRAREGVTGQLSYIIDSVERLLAYMEYIHPKLGDTAQQESLIVQEYLTHTTNEFARAVSNNDPELQLLANKIQQFVGEIKSLFHRFLRLQNRRML